MVEIDDKVISLEVIEKRFCCDLEKCKGACCVQGESGAPLEEEEVEILEKEYPAFREFLRSEGNLAIQEQGTFVVDIDLEMVTPLVDGKECAYAIFEDGIARCGIEKAFEQGKTSFRKPVSCHIYPIRVKSYNAFKAVNYDRWPICNVARSLGEEQNVRIFRFVRAGIERKFGPDFYQKLEILLSQIEPEEKD